MLEWLTQADEVLIEFVRTIGPWAYLVFFFIVLGENGVIPLIFLPGDGFVFSVGVIAATGAINIEWIYPGFLIAGWCGYQLNYWTGRKFGALLIHRKKHRWIKPAHLLRTQVFFNRYGKKAVFIGRFLPVIRTIMPFVAGLGKMETRVFLRYNLWGGLLWVSVFCFGGYFLGNLPFVQQHFLFIYLGLIIVATVPGFLSVFWWMKKET